MRIAILGATSQIAKDLIKSMGETGRHELYLYARRPAAVEVPASDRARAAIRQVGDYASFGAGLEFEALINFVGVGNPAVAAQMGAEIFDVTLQFDQLALNYIREHPQCRYIFLSSGAAYGSSFLEPAYRYTPATVPINSFTTQDWYGAAKLHAECRHRSYRELPIIDIRVFNYFSASQDLGARFFICDILRSIRDHTILRTSTENIVRDYLHPSDFCQLIEAVLGSAPTNDVVDGYSLAPVDKFTLLKLMRDQFGLNYELSEDEGGVTSTGAKKYYFSMNTRASDFGYAPTLKSIDVIVRGATELLMM